MARSWPSDRPCCLSSYDVIVNLDTIAWLLLRSAPHRLRSRCRRIEERELPLTPTPVLMSPRRNHIVAGACWPERLTSEVIIGSRPYDLWLTRPLTSDPSGCFGVGSETACLDTRSSSAANCWHPLVVRIHARHRLPQTALRDALSERFERPPLSDASHRGSRSQGRRSTRAEHVPSRRQLTRGQNSASRGDILLYSLPGR